MSSRDPYRILGVDRTASQDEIKKSYRKLARELHPDIDPDNPWAADDFKEISAAYNLLSNPEKRAAFDRGEVDAQGNPIRRASARRPGADPFAKFYKKRREGGEAIKVKGANVSYALKIDFAEAASGTTKRINTAHGKTLDVKIPPGTEDEQVLRLKGQGMPGLGGGGHGDALVTIRVVGHADFTRKGRDLHMDVPITLPEALFGTKIEVQTLDGTVAMTVPAGSNSGTQLRLKGKGIEVEGQGKGDLYVHLLVKLPNPPDEDLKKLVEKWAKDHPYSVRKKP